MPKKLTEKRVEEIKDYLENAFDPSKKTANGKYSVYASAIPKELNLELNFKPTKGVSVKIAGNRIAIGDLNKDELQNALDNFENLQAIGDAIGTKSTSPGVKVI